MNINYMSSSQNQKIIIGIEGNIGVGKSTFLERIKEIPFLVNNSDFIEEPVKRWIGITDENGDNILNKFYANKKQWAYPFQTAVLTSRITVTAEVLSHTTNKYIFLDRSAGTDKMVFATKAFDDGFIDVTQMKIYDLLYNYYNNVVVSGYKTVIIYLACDPKIALNRIAKRGRQEETNITLEDLEDINRRHEEWMKIERAKGTNILQLDCNVDYINNKEEWDKVRSQVVKFLQFI